MVLQRYKPDALSTASVLVTFLITVTETWHMEFKKRRGYFGSQFEDTQSIMVREATGAWGQLFRSHPRSEGWQQETLVFSCFLLFTQLRITVSGMAPSTSSMGFLSSVNAT